MDALTSFIIVIIAITIQFSLFAIKRLQEPLEPDFFIDEIIFFCLSVRRLNFSHFLKKFISSFNSFCIKKLQIFENIIRSIMLS